MAEMKKLNQVLAVAKSVQTKRETEFTKVYQDVQKPVLTDGFANTYTPLKDGEETIPPENKRVVLRVEDAIKAAVESLKEIFNIIALKDATNMTAKANIVIDGEVMVQDVPAVHLLFLEKRVAGIVDFINKLPVLNQDESWRKNEATGLYESEPVQSFRTKKIEDWKVIVPPTKEHPAQTVKHTVDENVGTWRKMKLSGSITADRKKQLLDRAEKIQKAVKVAREEANQAPIVPLATGKLVEFIFAP